MPHSYGSAVSGLLCRQAFRARKHTARIPRWDRNLPAQGNGCGTEKGRLTGWRGVKGERKSRKKCRGGRTTEVSAHPPVSPAKQERGTSASVWDSTPPLRARKRLGGANAIPTDAVDYGRKRWATVCRIPNGYGGEEIPQRAERRRVPDRIPEKYLAGMMG